jgi:hypothetical protein
MPLHRRAAAHPCSSTAWAQIVEEVPQAVRSAGDVHHLAEFFTSRLTDW